jgi:hypothetical protein
MTGVDWTQREGSDATTAWLVIRESGRDRRRWPSEKHGTSWLGWCPHQQVSGGTGLASRTRPTTPRAAAAWRLAAASLHHSTRALGAYVRRLQSRLGTPKASTATAHTRARLLDRRLKHGTAYGAPGLAAYAQPDRDRTVQHMARRAKELGYDLVSTPEEALA